MKHKKVKVQLNYKNRDDFKEFMSHEEVKFVIKL